MEDKYYTPELEDLFVGYECEMKNSSDPVHFDWETCIFKQDFSNQLNEDYCFEYLVKDLKDGNIRTKHLDKQDIESLGFIEVKEKRHYINAIQKVKLKNYYDPRVILELELEYDIDSKMLSLSYYCGEFANQIIFEGEIKSINEFRNIIKYLGINGRD